MNINKLKVNPSNPRIIKDHKFQKLKKSIQDFPEMMVKRPMVCVTDNADGKIYPLGGNMRLRAIQDLGMKEIPDNWIMMADDWTEEQRKEFVIKDNVSFGEWDFDELANSWDELELTDWGVDIPVWVELDDNTDTEVTHLLGDMKEKNDYLMFVFESKHDFEYCVEKLGLNKGTKTLDGEILKNLLNE